MNRSEGVRISNPEGVEDDCCKFTIDIADSDFVLRDVTSANQQYVFGCWVKSDAPGAVTIGETAFSTTPDWSRVVYAFDAEEADLTINFTSAGVYYLYNSKLEKGNTPTDWTPAIEDVQQGIDDVENVANDAQDAVDEVAERVTSAELSIDAINASIQSLVVGEDGESLMTQTESGWRFDMSSILSTVDQTTEDVTSIYGDLGGLSSLLEEANATLDAVTEKTAYITMSQDDSGDPCIELGKEDNDFKLRITNTSIDFMQGTQRIAYISNHQLYIQSSVVTDEMKIGYPAGYIWKKRSNNHMGLRYVAA